MDEKKIKVKIKPGHGIGGVGSAGDVVWMTKADADMYIRDGYVEVVDDKAPAPDLNPSPSPSGEAAEEDHTVIKPRAKRK